MLSQKHIFISALGVSLIINIFLGILVIQSNSNSGSNGIQRRELYHFQYLQASLCSSILNKEIARLPLDYNDIDDMAICYFIPPFACESCIQTQESFLLEAATSIKRIVVLVPCEANRDASIFFSDCDNIRIIQYHKEDLVTQELHVLQAGLFFKWVDNRVEDVYIPNPIVPEMTITFLNNQ